MLVSNCSIAAVNMSENVNSRFRALDSRKQFLTSYMIRASKWFLVLPRSEPAHPGENPLVQNAMRWAVSDKDIQAKRDLVPVFAKTATRNVERPMHELR